MTHFRMTPSTCSRDLEMVWGTEALVKAVQHGLIYPGPRRPQDRMTGQDDAIGSVQDHARNLTAPGRMAGRRNGDVNQLALTFGEAESAGQPATGPNQSRSVGRALIRGPADWDSSQETASTEGSRQHSHPVSRRPPAELRIGRVKRRQDCRNADDERGADRHHAPVGCQNYAWPVSCSDAPRVSGRP